MRAFRGWLCLLLAAAPAAAIEISTGFLIGARYDPRAFYVRAGAESAWRKTNTGPEYRKTAHGKLIGVSLEETAAIGPALGPGVGLVSLPLQSPAHSAFDAHGALLPGFLDTLGAKLSAADAAGTAVELVLFHPARDQEFFTTDSILEAARNLSDWLIRQNHRNVILNFAGDWTAPGWDFGNWIPLHFEQLADCVRMRFHEQRAGYTPPIALSVSVRMPEDAALLGAADLLLLSGEALALDPRKIERPAVVAGAQACTLAFPRLAGCLLPGASHTAPAVSQLLSKPKRAR